MAAAAAAAAAWVVRSLLIGWLVGLLVGCGSPAACQVVGGHERDGAGADGDEKREERIWGGGRGEEGEKVTRG
ncbi:hypothetical protein GGR56DRAFT_634392 [Xylariaceae sp. FL0804]|nr:hypothetical protein GGR56DRAFT_634392 [Xylariaceae sp. FL0804]